MKRSLTLIGAFALVVAGCGDDDSSGGASNANGDSNAAPSITIVQVEGLGEVLADADGMVLYMNDQEAADPGVVCEGACSEEWPPLVAGSGSPSAEQGVTGLGVSDRPDGTSQVTYNGHRLYTFAEDQTTGEASGDGLADEFDGQQFTWHAATVGSDAGATTPPAGTQGSGATGGGGYGY